MPQNNIDPFAIDMFIEQSEAVTVSERTYFSSQLSAVTAFETDEGIVLVDSGTQEASPKLAEAIRKETDAPIHTAIYTHGHLDHAYGLERFLLEGQDDPNIIAHEAMPARFARYKETSGHNKAIDERQFGGTVSKDEEGAADEDDSFHFAESEFQEPAYPPTTLYRNDLTIEVGGTTFEIHHNKGETDDHSWVYCPDRDVLCTGDFFINVAPNAGNPQKVQRYPWEWAETLKEMAGCKPCHLCPGHGECVINDPEAIQTRLLTTAEYLEEIVDRTLEALNKGSPPHVDIVHEVDIPEYDEPWLAETYDEGEFIVRNILRYYGGWWNGRPSELKPAPRDVLAEEIASLADSATALAKRAQHLAEDGEIRLAGHLADFALEAAPSDQDVQEIVATIYDQRAEAEKNLMAGNLYSSASEYARSGRSFR
ncbi:alkyl sulfatase dimerization domain-containing protein [Natronorubrum sp. FCH18a]|uniref:alkyl sulfatase dimerization domain-containing protein n=1 Tax=Natronorubrum sp. FCH18a TaxID=3447018 RepID=UPI003F51034C